MSTSKPETNLIKPKNIQFGDILMLNLKQDEAKPKARPILVTQASKKTGALIYYPLTSTAPKPESIYSRFNIALPTSANYTLTHELAEGHIKQSYLKTADPVELNYKDIQKTKQQPIKICNIVADCGVDVMNDILIKINHEQQTIIKAYENFKKLLQPDHSIALTRLEFSDMVNRKQLLTQNDARKLLFSTQLGETPYNRDTYQPSKIYYKNDPKHVPDKKPQIKRSKSGKIVIKAINRKHNNKRSQRPKMPPMASDEPPSPNLDDTGPEL